PGRDDVSSIDFISSVLHSNHGLDPFHWFVSRHDRQQGHAQLCWEIRGSETVWTALFPHQNLAWMYRKGQSGRIFFPFS
ncbi:hypothetical protein CHARACLAT_029819, partial [Characodon lateralis]|nr:hypothetical protein [Characodon lateralis]